MHMCVRVSTHCVVGVVLVAAVVGGGWYAWIMTAAGSRRLDSSRFLLSRGLGWFAGWLSLGTGFWRVVRVVLEALGVVVGDWWWWMKRNCLFGGGGKKVRGFSWFSAWRSTVPVGYFCLWFMDNCNLCTYEVQN